MTGGVRSMTGGVRSMTGGARSMTGGAALSCLSRSRPTSLNQDTRMSVTPRRLEFAQMMIEREPGLMDQVSAIQGFTAVEKDNKE